MMKFSLIILMICSCLSAECYRQKNLVSDVAQKASNVDPNLVNPWGLAFDDCGNLYVANNGPGIASSYAADGTLLNVKFSAENMPTGIEQNHFDAAFFFLYNSQQYAADFIFTNCDGMILAYAAAADPSNAITVVDGSSRGSVYTGLALGSYQGQALLFATDFHNGTVDVFDAMFNHISSFTDTTLPEGYAPINVQFINENLYVAFALQDSGKKEPEVGMEKGYVDIFRPDGILLNQLIKHEQLNAPWGLALASGAFGQFAGSLLVGNFGNGVINAYDPVSGQFLGQLTDEHGTIITIDGLRSIKFRDHDCKNLYFTAGPSGQSSGLLGKIRYYYICGFF